MLQVQMPSTFVSVFQGLPDDMCWRQKMAAAQAAPDDGGGRVDASDSGMEGGARGLDDLNE